MKRLILIMIAGLAVAAGALVTRASADLSQLSNPTAHNLACQVTSSNTVFCTGKISGLGSQAVTIQVSVPFSCKNQGGNFPGGLARSQPTTVQPQNGAINLNQQNTETAPATCPDQMTEAFGCTATIMVQSSDKGTFTFPADVKGCTQTA